MTDKFKSRYVLGEGYPFVHPKLPPFKLGIWDKLFDPHCIELDWPYEMNELEIPKYRLVLERIEVI